MSNGMGNPGMQPEVEPQVTDVPISVDGFVNRLQQRYGKMVAELMQENAELGAGVQALREANTEFRDRAVGLEMALQGAQASIEALQQALDQEQRRYADLVAAMATEQTVKTEGIAE